MNHLTLSELRGKDSATTMFLAMELPLIQLVEQTHK